MYFMSLIDQNQIQTQQSDYENGSSILALAHLVTDGNSWAVRNNGSDCQRFISSSQTKLLIH